MSRHGRNPQPDGRGAEPPAEPDRIGSLAARLARRTATSGTAGSPGAAGPGPATGGHTVVLVSTPPGVSGWADAYEAFAGALGLRVPADRSAADMIRQHLNQHGPDGGRLFWRAWPSISPTEPPIGYEHLANLAVQGCIDLVLTTSWDPLLEIAFSKVIEPPCYRVLIRGEMGDAEFARALRQRGVPQIAKLNGDLHSRLVTCTGNPGDFPLDAPQVVAALRAIFADALVLADDAKLEETDGDAATLVSLAGEAGTVCQASAAVRAGTRARWFDERARASGRALTDFDILMVDLDRQVELAAQPGSRLPAHAEVIRLGETDAAAIPPSEAASLIQRLAGSLANARPDCIAYVDDPLAPGGTEICRRLAGTPLGALPQLRVQILTRDGNRVLDRAASVPPELEIPRGARVALVDSVAFSGNTLRMAATALAARFGDIEIVPAVLISSSELADRAAAGEKWLCRYLYERITRRHEVAFPWGETFATDTVFRQAGEGSRSRSAEIFRRPWGSGEIFADSEPCSVRILTVDAGQQLSFQRHLCRDELFVALDSNVGVDLSSERLDGGVTGEFDSRIDSVTLAEGDYLLVSRGTWHRIRGQRARVRVLEVSFGIYDEDFDIDRLLDRYGRADFSG
jgi:mannose-6-phosphate isomerase-like protein (cupin superfamily)